MALKHYQGGGLPGDTSLQKGPQGPPAPPPVPLPAPVSHRPPTASVPAMFSPQPAQANAEGTPPEAPVVTVAVEHGEIVLQTYAESFDAAIEALRVQYEAAQPIQPLVWGDGKPVEGVAKAVLAEALGFYQDYLAGNATPSQSLMIGRLLAGLGVA